MQIWLAYGVLGIRRGGVAAGLLAAGLLTLAMPAGAQITTPDAPKVTAVAGNQKVSLQIEEPYDGGSAITGYEYRVKASTGTYPTIWTAATEITGTASEDLDVLVVVETLSGGTSLVNGTAYHFEVRAVNAEGAGDATEVTEDDEKDPISPQANESSTFTVNDQYGIITGRVPRVSATLDFAADIYDDDGTHIADDGDDRFDYQWTWFRVQNGVETEAKQETGFGGGTTYTLTSADVGSQLKVRVRFRDDRYNQEEHVSALFPTSGTILPVATCTAPTLTGGATQVWSAKIEISFRDDADWKHYGIDRVGLEVNHTRTFTVGTETYQIDFIYRGIVPADEADKLIWSLDTSARGGKPLTAIHKNQLTVHVCDEAYPLKDADHVSQFNDYRWPTTLDWSNYLTRTIYVSHDAVAPSLSTAMVDGTTLTLAYDEDLDAASVPAKEAFTVEVDSTSVSLTSTGPVAVSGRAVTVTLANPVTQGQTVTVSYTAPVSNPSQDASGNKVAGLTDQAVTNQTYPPTNCPSETLANRTRLWTGTLSVGRHSVAGSSIAWFLGYFPARHVGGLSPSDFTLGSARYQVDLVNLYDVEAGEEAALLAIERVRNGDLSLRLDRAFHAQDLPDLQLHACGSGGDSSVFALSTAEHIGWTESNLATGTVTHTDHSYIFRNSGLSWSEGDTVTLHLTSPASSDAQAIDPPTIEDTPRVSGAGEDGTWTEGETVEVAVTFSEAVEVYTTGGTPSIGVDLGGTASRSAAYVIGSGTAELGFRYTLVSGDGSHTIMSVRPNSLALDGGTIRSAETDADAQLAHNGTLAQGSSSRSIGPNASFQSVSKSQDGATSFTLDVEFSGAPQGGSRRRGTRARSSKRPGEA